MVGGWGQLVPNLIWIYPWIEFDAEEVDRRGRNKFLPLVITATTRVIQAIFFRSGSLYGAPGHPDGLSNPGHLRPQGARP